MSVILNVLFIHRNLEWQCIINMSSLFCWIYMWWSFWSNTLLFWNILEQCWNCKSMRLSQPFDEAALENVRVNLLVYIALPLVQTWIIRCSSDIQRTISKYFWRYCILDSKVCSMSSRIRMCQCHPTPRAVWTGLIFIWGEFILYCMFSRWSMSWSCSAASSLSCWNP